MWTSFDAADESGVGYKVTVTLSINLCTKYWAGVPFVNLLAIAEYVDLSILVKAESDCVVCVLFCLNVASNTSAKPNDGRHSNRTYYLATEWQESNH